MPMASVMASNIPSFILRLEADVAEVWFRQTYRSNLYNDVTAKVLQLKREEGQWRILSEGSR